MLRCFCSVNYAINSELPILFIRFGLFLGCDNVPFRIAQKDVIHIFDDIPNFLCSYVGFIGTHNIEPYVYMYFSCRHYCG